MVVKVTPTFIIEELIYLPRPPANRASPKKGMRGSSPKTTPERLFARGKKRAAAAADAEGEGPSTPTPKRRHAKDSSPTP